MRARAEAAALIAAPLGLLAARALGSDPLAVWFGFAVCILLPGWAAVRLLRLERILGLAGSIVAATALGLAVWTPPLAAAFVGRTSFGPALAVVLGATAVLCVAALRRPLLLELPAWWEALAGAVGAAAFGFVAWRLSTGVISDALFHVGRMRKIDEMGHLSLSSIASYENGAPHAGYAFPLMHAAFAGVARLANVDVATAFIYLQPLCACLAMLGVFAFVRALTGWRLAGVLAAVLLAWDLSVLINGLVMQINQPPVFTFTVLTPAALVLFVAALGGSRAAAPASMAAVGVIALVHPTYAIPFLAVAAGIAVCAWRAHLRMPAVALEALAASAVASFVIAVWIWWAAIHGGERRAIITHSDEFIHDGGHGLLMYPWAPVFGRGYVLVGIVALILLARYRPMLAVVGANLGLLALLLLPGLSTVVILGTGMGQFHRFWQVLPWPAAVAAGACVVAWRLGPRYTIAAAIALAYVLDWARPEREFWREPVSWLVVIALVAALIALIPRPRRTVGCGPWWGAALLVAAVLVGPIHYGGERVVDIAEAGPHRTPRPDLAVELTPDVVQAFRDLPGPPPVVLGSEHRVFELMAYANVYAAALPEARSRAEPKVDTQGRLAAALQFFDPETTAAERSEIVTRLDADYVLLDLEGQRDVSAQVLAQPGLSVVYRGPRFVILRVNRASTARSSGGSADGSSAA
ncbi:MAG: hypothetical protein QOF68_1845 [Gaiellales bacterium]|nr:hypothetical protein [Gaiellales bacterium]